MIRLIILTKGLLPVVPAKYDSCPSLVHICSDWHSHLKSLTPFWWHVAFSKQGLFIPKSKTRLKDWIRVYYFYVPRRTLWIILNQISEFWAELVHLFWLWDLVVGIQAPGSCEIVNFTIGNIFLLANSNFYYCQSRFCNSDSCFPSSVQKKAFSHSLQSIENSRIIIVVGRNLNFPAIIKDKTSLGNSKNQKESPI